jgi:hypothetical protein
MHDPRSSGAFQTADKKLRFLPGSLQPARTMPNLVLESLGRIPCSVKVPGRGQEPPAQNQLGIEMKASSLSFRAAVLFVIAGMAWGISMAISNDHAAMPAHAHLNLLGWVSLFLFGIFYFLHPAVDRSRTAMVQVVIWIIATVILTVGVGLVHTGHAVGDPIAAVGSLVVLGDMLLFAWIVFRRESAGAAAVHSAIPAE